MTPWLLVVGAVLCEVIGTISLRHASFGKPVWYAAVTVGYLSSFAFLSAALNEGLALGVVYGVWTACGVALTAIASRLLFDEPFTAVMMGGIALVAAGVLLVEIGSAT